MAESGPPPPPDPDISQNTAVTASEQGSGTNGPRQWEKAWTVEEMRSGANNWSLAGDAGLLLYLQDFSQRMISRVHEIEKEVDGLLHDSKLTGVRVHNVFNDFIMLADTQFVENRVYDEDVSQEDTSKSEAQTEVKEKTREEKEAELIPRVKEALELGVKVIDQAYEQLDSHVADSDSEEEETGYRVDPLLEAKDPYLNRPLPKMIGTPTFMEDDTVGLIEEESEEEETDNGSMSESEEDEDDDEVKKKPLSESDEYSSDEESETENKRKPSKQVDYEQESSESDGGLFGGGKEKESGESDESSEEEEDEEEEERSPKKPTGLGGFAAELAAKIGAPQAKVQPESEDDEGEREEINEEETKKKKSRKHRNKKESTSSKGKKESKKETEDEPFPQEEEDDPFGVKKGGGLFSSGGGLFDDDEDDDEGSMFDDDPKPKQQKAKKSVKEETVDKVDTSKTVKAGKQSSGGLFSDEDEEDLFSSVTSTTKPRGSSIPKEKSDLFADEEEEDLFASQDAGTEQPKPKKKATEKKLPVGAVSMFGGASNPLAAAIKKRSGIESDEEDKDWSEEEKSRSGSVHSNRSASINVNQRGLNKASPSPSSNSLFDDDGDDDALFSSSVKPRSGSKPKPKETKSLFEDDEDGDLFDTGSKPTSTQKKETKKPVVDPLFGGDDEDASFEEPKKAKDSKKPPGGVSLFGGVDVLNKQKNTPVAKEPEPVKSKEPAAKKPSLFDEDEDEEEDLFGAGAPKKEEPKSASQPKLMSKAKGLFDDDDLLFGGAEEESPDVDIFGGAPSSPPTSKTSKPTESVKVAAKPTVTSTGKGFLDEGDDDDDGDLFGTKSKTTENRAESIKVEGATTTESSDLPTEEEVKPKKPVGGVSMFGGVDPFAAIKKKTPATQKKEQSESPLPVDKPAAVPPTKTEVFKPTKAPAKKTVKDPLFGEDEEEEDDLFGAKKPTAVPVPTKAAPASNSLFGSPSPPDFFPASPLSGDSETKVEKPAKTRDSGDSLFDSEKSNDDDLCGASPPDKSDKEAGVSPPAPAGPKKPPGAVSMFGGVDIFAGIKKAKSESPDISEPLTKEKPAKKPDLSDSLFDTDKSNDDDLFGGSTTVTTKTDITEKESSEPPPVSKGPKKPAGAVSMFGGVDLFQKKEKNEVSAEDSKDFLEHSTEDSSVKQTHSAASVSPSKKSPTGRIGKLQMNLAINPAALLPGAAPPSNEPENTALDFDKPAQVKTLESANKSRAKIQTKRRPPSRQVRQSSAVTSSSATPSLPTQTPAPVENNLDIPQLPSFNDRVPQPSSDLFGNDDLLAEPSALPGLVSQASAAEEKQKDKLTDDLFPSFKSKPAALLDEDLFGGPITNTSKNKLAVTADDDDDIFGPSSKSKVSSKPASVMVNGDEDIFPSKSVKSAENSKNKSVIKVDDDDDDIFSTKTKTKKPTDFEKILDSPATSKAEKKSADTENQTTNKATNDGEDIFADSSLFKKKEDKTKEEKEEVKTNAEPETIRTNDDDMTPSKSKGKKSRAKAKTKDEDLFQDGTDIFADIPAGKPKEKKKKKAQEKKSLFKDTNDDIFSSDVTTTKTKAKKEKKKTETEKSKPQSTDVADIFDDPLS